MSQTFDVDSVKRTEQIERKRRIRNQMEMCKLRELYDQRAKQREKRSRDQ